MFNQLIIDNKTFDVVNKNTKKGHDIVQKVLKAIERQDTLDSVYARPSITKEAIYDKWTDFAIANKFDFAISSYNTSVFTMALFDYDETYILITPSHNYVVYGE